jgi:hypothetical protein
MRGGLIRFGLLFQRSLLCEMAASQASGSRAQQAMVTGIMAGDATDDCALDTSFGIGGGRSKGQRAGAQKRYNNSAHMSTSFI